jgi:hypothetical protein
MSPMIAPVRRPLSWQRPPTKVTAPYFHSREWRQLRAFVLRRENGICQSCHQCGADTIHHGSLRNDDGATDPSDCAAVHWRCLASMSAAKRGGP